MLLLLFSLQVDEVSVEGGTHDLNLHVMMMQLCFCCRGILGHLLRRVPEGN